MRLPARSSWASMVPSRPIPVRAAALAALLSAAAAPQRVPDTRIDTDPPGSATSRLPQIAASGACVHLVWQDARSGPPHDVYYNRSRDRGATWLADDVRIDTATPPGVSNEFTPRIAADDDAVYVVWRRTTPVPTGAYDDIYFTRSLDPWLTWPAAETRLNTGSAPVTVTTGEPRVAAAGSAVFVVWEDHRHGHSDVYLNRSLDRGTTWLGEVRLDTDAPGAETSIYPQIAASGDAVYVVWWDYRDGHSEIYFNRSLDRGATWLPQDLRLTHSPRLFGWRAQIAASGGAVYVVWEDASNGNPDVGFNRSLDGGATWLPEPARLDTGDPPGLHWSFYPQVAAQGPSVYVAWFDERNGWQDVYFNRSLDGGISWLPTDVRLDRDGPGAAYSAEVRVAASGAAVFVSWWDRRHSQGGDVYYNRSLDGGITWLDADRRLNTGPAPGAAGVGWPVIAAAGPSVYVAWGDGRNGSTDIYCNIPFGLQPYGSGTAGSGGYVPGLAGHGLATIGGTAWLALVDTIGSSAGVLVLGDAKAAWPALGGMLLVRPFATVGIVVGGPPLPGAGSAHVPLLLPPDPALVGSAVFFQAGVLDPGALGGITLSNAIELWIG